MDGLTHVPIAEIHADGPAREPGWADGAVAGPFVTSAPAPGQTPRGSVVLRLLSDDRRLYARFVVHDPEPERIRAGYGRRDSRVDDDGVALYVDPQGLGQRSYVFGCNALGVPLDGIRTGLAEQDDLGWDARWDCAASPVADGYVVEMAIPWRAMRHAARVERVGLLATWTVARLGQVATWPAVDPNAPNGVAEEAVVEGPGALPVPRGLELVPEVTWATGPGVEADDRLAVHGVHLGGTARFSPSQAIELLGTWEPDFSQVESDGAQVTVNRRYALDYPEKRPFFLQGQEWFDHPAGALVYTRSIVAPVYGARSTIEAGPVTLAVLHALDRHPAPTVSEGGGFGEAELGDAEAYDTV
ncbi:MAG: sugar-binding protein, partial [Myxococcota bacterium]